MRRGSTGGKIQTETLPIGAVKTRTEGKPDPKHVSTSYAERNNPNVRMHSRRLTRLTNAFSKKLENHAHAMALHFMYYTESERVVRFDAAAFSHLPLEATRFTHFWAE